MVNHSPVEVQFYRQGQDVIALLHALDYHPLKLDWIPIHSSLSPCHSAAPFSTKCGYNECLTFGVQSPAKPWVSLVVLLPNPESSSGRFRLVVFAGLFLLDCLDQTVNIFPSDASFHIEIIVDIFPRVPLLHEGLGD